ncbi:MAG TPA: hypothetical protein VMR50_04350 [Myxococcota bacterium]|nr:hypothetical protein [Myxococcota bacterium]
MLRSWARNLGAALWIALLLFACESILLALFDLPRFAGRFVIGHPGHAMSALGSFASVFLLVAMMRAWVHVPGLTLGLLLAFWIARVPGRLATLLLVNFALFWLLTWVLLQILEAPQLFDFKPPLYDQPVLRAAAASLLSPIVLWRWLRPLLPTSESPEGALSRNRAPDSWR